jgi:hypothetical protein
MQHNESYSPIQYFEQWDDLGRDLEKQAGHNGISDGDLINVAPLQFSGEVLRVHSELLRTKRDDFLHERFEARITSKWIEQRIVGNT